MSRRAVLTAAIAATMGLAGSMGGAVEVQRPFRDDPSPPVPRIKYWRKHKGPRSNAKRKLSPAAKKRAKAKASRVSRRANLRGRTTPGKSSSR